MPTGLTSPILRPVSPLTSPPAAPPWMTYRQAGAHLGLSPEAVARRAKRGGWPTRHTLNTGEAEIQVPRELLAEGAKTPARKQQRPAPDAEGPALADAVQAAVAPLQAALERQEIANKDLQTALDVARAKLAASQIETARAEEQRDGIEAELAETAKRLERAEGDRQILQGQADAVRTELHTAQLEAAQTAGKAATEAARREGAEREAAELRRQLEAAQAKPRRRWWWP